MKKPKIRLPKKLLRLPFLSNFFLWLINSIVIAGIFIVLSITQGIFSNIKNNTTKNYNSHLTVSSMESTQIPTQSLQSWWNQPLIPLEQSTSQEYIRAIVKRSILFGLYNKNDQQFPIQLTVLNNNDSTVFDNFMSINKNNTYIPINQVFIGKALANKLELKVGDTFPIEIPSISYSLSNITIGYIFNSPDRYYDNYGVYINSETLSLAIGSKFQQYHLRFFATPFLPLVLPNISAITANFPQKQADDHLNYQYKMLTFIKNNIMIMGYWIYGIIGILLFLRSYSVFYKIHNDINQYTYRTGFVPKLSLTFRFFIIALKNLAFYQITALGFLSLFLYYEFSIPSSILALQDGLYQNLSLPINFKFTAELPILTILQMIGMGTFCGLLGFWVILFIYHIIPNFSDSNNKTSYITISMLLVMILGYITSDGYLFDTYTKKSRDNFWQNMFFGKYMLVEKNFLDYKYLKIPPKNFPINNDIFTILQEKQIPYVSTLETFGQVFSATNSVEDILVGQEPKYLVKDVSIKSLRGQNPYFSNIISYLSSNQVVIGKNVANTFFSNEILSLALEKQVGEKVNTTIIVSHIIDIPIGDFNDTIFINHNSLANMLNIPNNSITTLQISSQPKLLSPYTNQNILLIPAEKSYYTWNILTNMVLYSKYFISVIMGICFFILLLAVVLYISIKEKELLWIYYVQGIPYKPLNKITFIGLGSFLLGIIFSGITKIYFLIYQVPIPKFLIIPKLSPPTLLLAINWWTIPLLLGTFLILFLICYIYFRIFLRKIQRKLISYLLQDTNS